MKEQVKIVQLVRGTEGESDYCLDADGNIYKIEYVGRNKMTLVKQEITVVIP